MKIFSQPIALVPKRPGILDPYGVPLTNERTDAVLRTIAEAQYRITSALDELTEAGKMLSIVKHDVEQSQRLEVRYAIGSIFKTWDFIRTQVNFEYANPVFYDLAGSSSVFDASHWLSLSYDVPATDTITLEFESSSVFSGIDVSTSGLLAGPSLSEELLEVATPPDRTIAPPPVEAESCDGPTNFNPAAELIATAKRELKAWLTCGSIELAQLLNMSRQTLHDADNPRRRPQGRTAAKILDVHAMLAAHLADDRVSRLAWLRTEGRELWSARGLPAFMSAVEEQLFPVVAQPSIYGLSFEAEDEPVMRVKPSAPR